GNPVQINPTVMKIRDSIIMAEFTVTSFSNFAPLFNPGNAPTPVPVDWLEFTGRKRGENNELNWATASELNCSHFEIERSTDGKSFRVVGIEEGNGTTNSIFRYRFTDENPSNLKLFYRLKQIDYNGESSYSNVITIQPEAELIISPNPFKQNIEVSVEKQEIIRVELIDMFGRIVFEEAVNDTKTAIKVRSELDHGVYTLRVVLENSVVEKRVIKE
ncbi:MAG: T9SS type A sorting domain-containing protein, partial [Bacteroidia bacterium]|nr:T9SS type A sorting domain-containing protein [Bacteroidia bacterium]